jgi:hypothetical protein
MSKRGNHHGKAEHREEKYEIKAGADMKVGASGVGRMNLKPSDPSKIKQEITKALKSNWLHHEEIDAYQQESYKRRDPLALQALLNEINGEINSRKTKFA